MKLNLSRAEVLSELSDAVDYRESRAPFDYFISIHTQQQLLMILSLAFENLSLQNKKVISCGDAIKFIGIIILGTLFQFGLSRNLSSQTPLNLFIDAPAFGSMNSMTLCLFYELWYCLKFSKQSDRSDYQSS